MKLSILLIAFSTCMAASLPATAADDHKGHDHAGTGAHKGHDDKARHGGVVSVVKDVNYELVVKGDVLALYITDHGKPVDLKGATAKLTLLSAGGKSEATLAPAGDHLEAKGPFKLAANTKALASIALAGQAPVSVRFTIK